MELKELLTQIDSLKAEIDKLRPLKPEVALRIIQKFRLDWNYHSNAIEGNSLTLGETRAFLLEGLTASGKPLKDHLDIKGHDELITFLELFIQRKERLTEAAIREMHKILLKEPYETDAITPDGRIVKKKVRLGEYKQEPNAVRMGSGQIHQYVLPEDVPAKMAELVEWQRVQEEKPELHPVVLAALFHYRFVSIHPFDDGNGRMGRILMNSILMRSGYPPAIIKLKDREPYVAALRRADANEPEGVITFIGQNLLDAENLYLRGARGEAIEDADDVDKAVSLLKQRLKSIPPPTELSVEVQTRFFSDSLQKLLARLDKKLIQFDELFASEHVDTDWVLGNGVRIPNAVKRDSLPKFLEDALTKSPQLIKHISITFHWDNFLKGSKPFSIATALRFQFAQRTFSFAGPVPALNRQFQYGSWFTEDELQILLSGTTKRLLQRIEEELPKTLGS